MRKFIESFRNIDPLLIESVLLGYGLCFESHGDLNVNFEHAMNGGYYGYKIMKMSDGAFESGANNSIKLPSKVGVIHSMPGGGIFISNNPSYVVDYYSYLEDDESYDEGVIQYVFYIDDVVDGKSQLGDREPEIGVRKAYVNAIIPIREWNNGKRFQSRGMLESTSQFESRDVERHGVLKEITKALSSYVDSSVSELINDKNSVVTVGGIKNGKLYGVRDGDYEDLDISPDIASKLSLSNIYVRHDKGRGSYNSGNRIINLSIPDALYNDDDWEWMYKNRYRARILTTLLHELVHSWDTQDFTLGGEGDYIKQPSEVNAWLQHLVYASQSDGDTFEDFIDDDIAEWLRQFSGEQRKSILKRLYAMWNGVKQSVNESIGYHGTPANFSDFNTPIIWFTSERDLAQEYAGNDGKVIEKELDYKNPVRFHSSTQVKGIREFLGDFIEQSSVRDFSPRVRELHRLIANKFGDSKQEIWNYFDDKSGMLKEFALLLGFDAIESSEGNSLTKRHPTIGLFK